MAEKVAKRRNEAGGAAASQKGKKTGENDDGKTEVPADTTEPKDDEDGTGRTDPEDSKMRGAQAMGEVSIPVKKQVENSEIQIGSCKFCGQDYQIETSGVCSQEQLDEWATEKCDCGEAKEERKMKEQERKAERNIKKMFGEYDAVPVLLVAVHPIAIEAIDSVTVSIGNVVKATIKLTSKGKIQVKKTTTLEDTLEN